jgi:hypothetical protein
VFRRVTAKVYPSAYKKRGFKQSPITFINPRP